MATDPTNKAGVLETREEDRHDSANELFAIMDFEGFAILAPANDAGKMCHRRIVLRKFIDIR